MNASWPALFALSTSETPRPRRRKKGYRPKRQNSLREIMPGPSKSQEQGTVYSGHARLRPFDARLRIITFWVLSGACHAAHTSASQRHPRARVSSPSISHFTSLSLEQDCFAAVVQIGQSFANASCLTDTSAAMHNSAGILEQSAPEQLGHKDAAPVRSCAIAGARPTNSGRSSCTSGPGPSATVCHETANETSVLHCSHQKRAIDCAA